MYVREKDSSILPHDRYVCSKRKFTRGQRLELLNNIGKLIGRMDILNSESHDLFLGVPQHPTDCRVGGNELPVFNLSHHYTVQAVVEQGAISALTLPYQLFSEFYFGNVPGDP